MSNVTPFPKDKDTVRLQAEHGTSPEQLRAMLRDLALWMHDKGIEHVAIDRQPGTALFQITIDGKQL